MKNIIAAIFIIIYLTFPSLVLASGGGGGGGGSGSSVPVLNTALQVIFVAFIALLYRHKK